MTDISYAVPQPTAEGGRFRRFLALGGIAAAVNWLSRFALSYALPFPAAVAVAYVMGMIVAFTLFRRFVFPLSSAPLARQVLFFIVVNIAGLGQVWLVSMVLVTYALPAIGRDGELWRSLAHGFAIGVPAISSYVGHKFLTFRE